MLHGVTEGNIHAQPVPQSRCFEACTSGWMDGSPPSAWSAVEVPRVSGCPALLSINVLVVLHAEGFLGPAGGSCWAQTQAGAVQWGSRTALTSWLAGLQQQGHVCCRGCSEDGARMGPELHAATQFTVLSIHCTLAPRFYFMGVQVMEQWVGQGLGKLLSLQHPQLWGGCSSSSDGDQWHRLGNSLELPPICPCPLELLLPSLGGMVAGQGGASPGLRTQHRSTQHILWRRCRNQLPGAVSAGLPRAGQLLSDPFPPQLARRGVWLTLGAVWGLLAHHSRPPPALQGRGRCRQYLPSKAEKLLCCVGSRRRVPVPSLLPRSARRFPEHPPTGDKAAGTPRAVVCS